MKNLFPLLLCCALVACDIQTEHTPAHKTESEAFKKGRRQLELQGYTNIQETGLSVFCCDKKDSYFFSTGFVAYKDGEKVEGCMCTKSGLFRNSVTIRFN